MGKKIYSESSIRSIPSIPPAISGILLLFCLASGFMLSFTGCKKSSPTGPTPPSDKGYSYYYVGNNSDVTTSTSPGLVLMGGGSDVDEAYRWMIQKSGGGDFVVIRASGSDA